MARLILHEYAPSGNCYKIRLTAALLDRPIERRGYDILKGETRTPAFLETVNANGRIPVLQIGDRFLPESNAACWWLACRTPLVPDDPFDQADMLRWMFFEQYNHEPNVATLRFWRAMVGEDRLTDAQRAQMPAKVAAGEAALTLMDEHLATRRFFVGDSIGLADVCLCLHARGRGRRVRSRALAGGGGMVCGGGGDAGICWDRGLNSRRGWGVISDRFGQALPFSLPSRSHSTN